MKKRIYRIAFIIVALALVAGAAAPFVDAAGYRARITAALEHSLNRKVKVGEVRFNLFTGPGFTVSDVEIADDPSMGIEPLAYVDTLEARVTLRTLWTRELGFSNLKLKEPTLNLVKNDAGMWNFQLLRGVSGEFPALQVRDGRINFKFGDTKSVFYLSESDLDIDPLGENRLDIRFAGQPSRTDQAQQSFGMLLARGTWKRPASGDAELDINAELEKSAISELARLIEGKSIGLHGVAGSKARITGPISKLAVNGQLKLDDVHRWDLLPKGGGWQLNYRGLLDLNMQRLQLEALEKDNPGTPLAVRFEASGLLSHPQWSISAELHDVPAQGALETARHMGAAIPDGMTVEGKLNGAVAFTRPGGLEGQLTAQDASVRSSGAPVVKFPAAEVLLKGSRVEVGPSTAEAENGQSAELTASYEFETQNLDVKVTTAGMKVGELQKGSAPAEVLGAFEKGTWKGWLRYQRTSEDGAWSGDFEVRSAVVNAPGLAAPVRVESAAVALDGERVTVTKMRGSVDGVNFAGEFRRDKNRADRVKIDIAEAELSDLERLLAPSLQRKQGLLARFRLRQNPVPDWMRERKLEGTLQIGKLTAGEDVWRVTSAKLQWHGTSVKLTGIEAAHGDEELTGDVSVNLARESPAYHVAAKASGFDYKGGTLALDATADSQGTGAEVVSNARVEGTFEGEDVAFAPDMEFKTISGAFEWGGPGKLRIRNLQAGQGFDNYTGQGASQADGRLVLDLTSGKRQVKVAGTLANSPVVR